MCTATWCATADGYALFFNRDEARTRAAEQPARRLRRGGVECLAPFDAAGGTWIGANELGFTACLLNAYPEHHDPQRLAVTSTLGVPRAPRALSRGFLVLGLLDAASVAEARRRVQEGDLRWFQPFRLVAFAPGETPLELFWDGLRLVEERLPASFGMVCSSGWDDGRARRARGAMFDARFRGAGSPPTAAELTEFHRSHAASLPVGPIAGPVDLAAGAESVCMHRPDACTVSFVSVRVEAERVSLAHRAGAPCAALAALEAELSLPRRAAAARLTGGSSYGKLARGAFLEPAPVERAVGDPVRHPVRGDRALSDLSARGDRALADFSARGDRARGPR